MKQIKRYSLFLIILLFIIVSFPFGTSAETDFISNPSDFQNALKKGQPEIYIGDITFAKETAVTLNYKVKIIGKSEKSTIKNAYFTVVGSNVPGESVDVAFENIILDGQIDKKDYDFSVSGKTFRSVFGNDRENKQAICGTYGYFSVNLNNCEVKGYASYSGPAIYTVNNVLFREGKQSINITDTLIHHNICYSGTVSLGNDIGNYTLKNCRFYENIAKEGSSAVISNGKATVKNCDFCKNAFYRFVNTAQDGTEKYPTDKISANNKEYNYAQTPGTLYIGGADALIENCRITDNTGLYGGGVGVMSPTSVVNGEKIEFKNCIISKNSAECGGAIYAKSVQGHTVNFINCNIFGNSAEKGGILYTTTLVPYTNDMTIVYGGKISFVFCSIAENCDSDADTFTYYELRMPRLAGSIELLGCMVIDKSEYTGGKYNYIASKETALNDNAVSEKTINGIYTNGLSAVKNSKADISVPANVYSSWATDYSTETAPKKIGATFPTDCGYTEKDTAQNGTNDTSSENTPKEKISVKPKNELSESSDFDIPIINETPESTVSSSAQNLSYTSEKPVKAKNSKALFLIVPIAVLIIGGGILLFFILPRCGEKSKTCITDFSVMTDAELLVAVTEKFKKYSLTNKELEVASLILTCEKRKDIAEKLVVSEDTVKTHISHIFKKVGVSSKEEFKELASK